MKKHLSDILAAVACLLVIVCMFQISALKQQVGNLQNVLNSQMSNVSDNINGIYSNVSSMLEEQASLLADSSWEFGEADMDALTVELLCSVSPKEYASGTAATIVVDGVEQPMTISNGTFTAKTKVPLFAEVTVSKVVFREGDTVRTEALDWHLSPRGEYLPNVYANLDGSSTGSVKDGIYAYHREGVVNVDVDCGHAYELKSVTLVETIDDQEIGRTDIPLDNKDFFENYQSEDGARPEPAESLAQSAGTELSSSFYYGLDKDYEIPFGTVLTIYVEVEDGNGLFYRCIIDRTELNEIGDLVDDSSWWCGSESSIYDANGKGLYEIDPNLYQ
ncbi:hypothetical protein SDC9_88603 [bioreactor metagenome]|uniref:Uncharacterized protein n=1 Tax=bioreactor metagenome TaxID=1076179 RepID=A0A644ZPY8_9ZZZZ